jgi:hypothetical protein
MLGVQAKRLAAPHRSVHKFDTKYAFAAFLFELEHCILSREIVQWTIDDFTARKLTTSSRIFWGRDHTGELE